MNQFGQRSTTLRFDWMWFPAIVLSIAEKSFLNVDGERSQPCSKELETTEESWEQERRTCQPGMHY